MKWIALYLLGFGILHAGSFVSSPSPDGKFGIAGTHSDLFIVDVASGTKLCPLLPKSQQGQLGNIDVTAKWAPNSSLLAVCVSYGTRLDELLFFSVSESSAHSVKYHEPDLSKLFPQLAAEDDSTRYDYDSLGDWIAHDTIHVTFGAGKTGPDGTMTRYFLLPAYVTISKGRSLIKLGKPTATVERN